MLPLIAAGLCALFQAPSDPLERARVLVEKFRSDEVQVRNAAAAELKMLGEAVRSVLENAVRDKDAEVAGRARDVLQFLDRRAEMAKHPWGAFKPGSFTKMKSLIEMTIGGNPMKCETTITYVLKAISEEECLVEIETTASDVPPQKSDLKIPLQLPEADESESPKPRTRSGTEEIVVAGKKLKCEWSETETEANGVKSVTKVYTHASVPGGIVKSLMKNGTMTSTIEVLEFSSK